MQCNPSLSAWSVDYSLIIDSNIEAAVYEVFDDYHYQSSLDYNTASQMITATFAILDDRLGYDNIGWPMVFNCRLSMDVLFNSHEETSKYAPHTKKSFKTTPEFKLIVYRSEEEYNYCE